jgi:hypothetical protein
LWSIFWTNTRTWIFHVPSGEKNHSQLVRPHWYSDLHDGRWAKWFRVSEGRGPAGIKQRNAITDSCDRSLATLQHTKLNALNECEYESLKLHTWRSPTV